MHVDRFPETQFEIEQQVEILSHQLDTETATRSGGFEEFGAFKEVINYGEAAMPVLMKDMADPDSHIQWWQINAIIKIADNMGKSIEFPKDTIGRYDARFGVIAAWGYSNGYLQRPEAGGPEPEFVDSWN